MNEIVFSLLSVYTLYTFPVQRTYGVANIFCGSRALFGDNNSKKIANWWKSLETFFTKYYFVFFICSISRPTPKLSIIFYVHYLESLTLHSIVHEICCSCVIAGGHQTDSLFKQKNTFFLNSETQKGNIREINILLLFASKNTTSIEYVQKCEK